MTANASAFDVSSLPALAGLAEIYLDLLNVGELGVTLDDDQKRELRWLVRQAVEVKCALEPSTNQDQTRGVDGKLWWRSRVGVLGNSVCNFCRTSIKPGAWFALGTIRQRAAQKKKILDAQYLSNRYAHSREWPLDELIEIIRQEAREGLGPKMRRDEAVKARVMVKHAQLCALRYLSSVVRGIGDPRQLVSTRE